MWDYEVAPADLYQVFNIIKWTTLATDIAHPEWSPSSARPGLVEVSETVSAVNAGIVDFIGDGMRAWAT